MKQIREYIDYLLEKLEINNEVLGVLLYGSYALEQEDEFSDIDILIVVEEINKNICGRGNILKDGISIEYFIKTESEIYEELLYELEIIEPVMRMELLTGNIFYEKYSTLSKLKKRAEKVNLMPYKQLSTVEIQKLTITLRNQIKEIDRKNKHKDKDLCFCYYNYLYELIKTYCYYEGIPFRKYKFFKTYTNEKYRIKNMQLDIKDEYVKSKFIYLITNLDTDILKELTEYILNKLSQLPIEYRIYTNIQ